MATETKVIPAAPVVPADDTNIPPAAPAEPIAEVTPPADPEPDHLLAAVLAGLQVGDEPIEPAVIEEPAAPTEPAPAADAPAAVPAEPVPAAPAAPAPAAKKKVRSPSRGNPLIDPPVPTVQAVPAPASTPVVPDAQMTDEQREELEEAEVAARLFPDRYGGQTAALKKWYSDFDARSKALIEKNPNVTEDDEEFQALLRTKPAIKPLDARKVQRKLGEESAVSAAEQRIQPKIDQLAMEAKRAAILPQASEFASVTFVNHIRDLITADAKSPLAEALKVYVEKGQQAASEEFPLEFGVMLDGAKEQIRRVQEFILMTNRAVAFDPEKNADHRDIANFIENEGRSLAAFEGGKYTQRNGRQFLGRAEFIAMMGKDKNEGATFDPKSWQTTKYWTFTDSAILDMMAIRTKEAAEKAVGEIQNNAKRYGFARQPKKSVEPAQTPPTEIIPPKAGARPSPGAGSIPKPTVAADDSPIPLAGLVANLKITK